MATRDDRLFLHQTNLPAVKPLMSSQSAFDDELRPTRSTDECFLTHVEQHVSCEVRLLEESRGTNRSLEPSLTRVSPSVSIEVAPVPVCLLALIVGE